MFDRGPGNGGSEVDYRLYNDDDASHLNSSLAQIL